MSQCIVPSWTLMQQRQEHSQGDDRNRSSTQVDYLDSQNHSLEEHHQDINISQVIPMSNFEVTELTWENGQLAMHELGGIFPPPISTTSSAPKTAWEDGGVDAGGAGDTLESIVHQATYCNKQVTNLMLEPQQAIENNMMENTGSVVASCGSKWVDKSKPIQTPRPPPPSVLVKKRTRSEVDHRGFPNDHESACASANAASTMMTWSYESPRSSTRTKTINDEDSACHGGSENQEEERETKGETGRSYPTRKGRAAAVHNQSERRRRDRINQKMKALQKLVPNSSKTDKASMLDEVIEYLKQLQAQVQMMSQARFMPHLMMPLGIQQQLHQMSLLTRMGMGMGMGMPETPSIAHTPLPAPQSTPSLLQPSQVAAATSTFVPPAFVPQMIAANQFTNPNHGTGSSAQLQDPYNILLAQSMNLELCNRIAALQRQQLTPSQPASNQFQPNHHVQRS